MQLLRRLHAFGRYAAELAALAPSGPARVRVLAVACWLLARQYLPRLPAVVVTIRIRRRDATLSIQLRNYGDLDVVHELFVRDEYAALSMPDDARIVVDVGANIGLASMEFALRYPQARIIACEPDPDAYDMLRRNVGSNPRVEIHNVALSDQDGEATLWTSATSVVSSFHRTLEAQHPARVRTVILASLMREAAVEHIDLLKLDVEGAERLVLADPDALARIDVVVGEIHPSLIGQDAESFCRERLRDFDVTLLPRPRLEHQDERLLCAVRRR